MCVYCSTAPGVLALAIELTDIRPTNILLPLRVSPVGACGWRWLAVAAATQEVALPVNDATADGHMAPSGRPTANRMDGQTDNTVQKLLLHLVI